MRPTPDRITPALLAVAWILCFFAGNLPAGAEDHATAALTTKTAPSGCSPEGEPLCDGIDTECDGVVDVCDTLVFLPGYARTGVGPGEVLSPWGLTRDASGNLYLAEPGKNRVQVFNDDGAFLRQLGSLGTGPGEFRSPLNVTVDDAGNVWVADNRNDRVQKLAPDGTYLMEIGDSGGPGELTNPWGIAVDDVGNVYVGDADRDEIVKFDPAGEFITAWGGTGSSPGELNLPADIVVAPDGTLLVVDTQNDRVQRFTTEGVFIEEIGDFLQFFLPIDQAFDDQGNYYVCDWNNHVTKFDPSLQNVQAVVDPAAAAPETWQLPVGVVVNPDGEISLAVTFDLIKLDPGGAFITRWGEPEIGPGELEVPTDVAVGPSGNAYVTDGFTSRVSKFDSNGEFLLDWSLDTVGGGSAVSVAVDGSEIVYVADNSTGRVLKYDGTGNLLLEWGNGIHAVSAIAVDGDGHVFVADSTFDRVIKFDDQGNFLLDWPVGGSPRAVATDADGNVYVTAFDNLIHKFTGGGLPVTAFGGPISQPRDIVVNRNDRVFVGQDGKILEFTTDGDFIGEYESLGRYEGLGADANGIIHAADGVSQTIHRLGCVQPGLWYLDDDGDGHGVEDTTIEQCGLPDGYAAVAGDCDDAEPRVNPGNTELCDGLDNDCDGLIDETFPGMRFECGDPGACGQPTTQCAGSELVCVEDCDQQLCKDTGGMWDPLACGDYICGVPQDGACVTGGCNCGPGANFDSGEGCLADPSCPEAAIPTMSEWGLLALAISLLVAGAVIFRRIHPG